ncbi:Transmembrane protein 65, partial [Globisporangium splendens]
MLSHSGRQPRDAVDQPKTARRQVHRAFLSRSRQGQGRITQQARIPRVLGVAVQPQVVPSERHEPVSRATNERTAQARDDRVGDPVRGLWLRRQHHHARGRGHDRGPLPRYVPHLDALRRGARQHGLRRRRAQFGRHHRDVCVENRDPRPAVVQANMPITHWCNFLASAGGITLGCLLGMFPLLFMNHSDECEEGDKKSTKQSEAGDTTRQTK